MALTPTDVHHGHPEYPAWTGWSFDGLVRVEETEDGKSTRDTDGYDTFSLGAMRPTRPKVDAKLETVGQAGSQECLDYALSGGLYPGGCFWGALKKAPLGEANHTKQTFILSSKSGVTGIPADGARHVFTVPTLEQTKTALKGKGDMLKYPMRPFMWHFFYTPDGASPSRDMYEYEDEEGHMHYDALIVAFGRVEFPPIKYHPLPAATAETLKPLTNGFDLMIRHPFTILLAPQKDGIFCNV